MPIEIFTKENEDKRSCFGDFQIAHDRSAEGYSNDWYDEDLVYKSTYSYQAVVPERNGDLYFSTDGYYIDMIPLECTKGVYTDKDGEEFEGVLPAVFLEITNERTNQRYSQYYYEFISFPVLVPESEYWAGDRFSISVFKGFPHDHPAQEYTVRVYSKMDIQVQDTWGRSSIQHMDGQQPSGFTNSDFCGMDCIKTIHDLWDLKLTDNEIPLPVGGELELHDSLSESEPFLP